MYNSIAQAGHERLFLSVISADMLCKLGDLVPSQSWGFISHFASWIPALTSNQVSSQWLV
jgi:hypothetical protein